MDGFVSDISCGDPDIFKDASHGMRLWIGSLKTATKCKPREEVTKDKPIRQTKEALVQCLLDGYQTVCSHSDTFESSRVNLEQLESELIAAQRSVVDLQQQTLAVQAEQLNKISTAVETAVDRGIISVQRLKVHLSCNDGIFSYSDDGDIKHYHLIKLHPSALWEPNQLLVGGVVSSDSITT